MPSLNQANFIECAIRSVLSQSTTVLELIVMDGGSTDGTQAILTRLAQKSDGRLRWRSEADSGPAQALNKALTMAQGDIIGWLNADDLYETGAIERATQAFKHHPEWSMVYGQGRHIDECGRDIGDYPTLQPETSIQAFADGCFICQPTVFLRKKVVNQIGLMDESLKTAFDLEWWLRIFSQHKKNIGFIDAIQANSRLHSACITRNQRETVIRESMQVLAQYLGACPLHWFKTYTNEVLTNYPHGQQVDDIKVHLKRFARSISGYLSKTDKQELRTFLDTDARIKLATPDAYLEVYSDAWLPVHSSLRVRSRRRRWRSVELKGRHVSKSDEPLQFKVFTPEGMAHVYRVEKRGPFLLRIELPTPVKLPAFWGASIEATGGFIPSEYDPGSDDNRELVCLIDAIQLHRW